MVGLPARQPLRHLFFSDQFHLGKRPAERALWAHLRGDAPEVFIPVGLRSSPYNVPSVRDSKEGPRFATTNIVGIANEEIRVGMPVIVEWESATTTGRFAEIFRAPV
jgi:hypothetical protein